MNNENLMPISELNDNLTREERERNASKAGKASVAARRRKKSMKQKLELLLSLPVCDNDRETLEALGVDASEMDNEMVILKGLFLKAATGDVAAVKEIRSILGKDNAAAELAIRKREFALKKLAKQEHNSPAHEYSGIPASLIAPTFSPVLFDIYERRHSEYIFPGGRGSTKSSFVGLNVIDLIMKHEDIHALALRQVSNTIKDSIYAQLQWAISALGLDGEFELTKSPLEITRKKTGQKIFFRGADDPGKIKSVKPPFGYIGILWFEELDQFRGEEEVRKIEQSAIRGGELAYIFKSFNPPKSAHNWANMYIKTPNTDRLVTESTYLTVPQKWLGKPFLDMADFLRETNPIAYENEYMGVANGSGGGIFDNVEIRDITDEELSHFDNIFNGVDWGWYPDPFAFIRCHYDSARHTLYIWQEYTCNKQSNEQTAKKLKELGITQNDLITCDSAENKSVGDYRAFGLAARAAEKGPNSREYSYKWLQSLRAIIIDNKRCPVAAVEFLHKEYDRDKEGNVISGYPDGNDHCIDAVRYATERVWKRRGQ